MDLTRFEVAVDRLRDIMNLAIGMPKWASTQTAKFRDALFMIGYSEEMVEKIFRAAWYSSNVVWNLDRLELLKK